MRIGIYGGTFNPIHMGHITAARAAMEQLQLDKLLLIPANVPPHKQLPPGSADPSQRLEMTQLACAELGSAASVSDVELRRTGKSYTSDTLRALRREYPDDELWLLMGSDMFLSLHTWHEPEVILGSVSVGAFSRVEAGEELAVFYVNDETQLDRAVSLFKQGIAIKTESPQPLPLVYDIVE